MPKVALHPQARFDPIPPNLDLGDLIDSTANFHPVTRLSTNQIGNLAPRDFERLILRNVIEGGRPLVIEGWNRALPNTLFSAGWMQETFDKKQEMVRDITAEHDMPMTMGHYLRSMKQLTNQWTTTNFRDERRQRLYLKDIDCPPQWVDHLRKVIPSCLFYLNGNVEEKATAAVAAPGNNGGPDMFGEPQEKTAAVAGDLMSSLPESMRAENLMCYIGHEGTYTPAHKEMCASLGQNIMVEASGSGNGERPGSSIWFMTESKDCEVVKEYFRSMLGHDIEIEKHFAQINAWRKANFPVYVVEQRVGDFILIPPLAPHQVWNRGTRTIKVAWNRTTVETLKLALHEALPRSRLVCRDEQYKNKAIIYFTLKKYFNTLSSIQKTVNSRLSLGADIVQNSPRMIQMAKDFKTLFALYTEIITDEMLGFKETSIEFVKFDSNITCSYCRSNIFNRFLTCKHCVRELVNGDQDTYDVCMECYAMGRSCVCTSGLQWCEQFLWKDLANEYEQWRALIIKNDGFVDIKHSPQPLEIARRLSGKISVAHICQGQLLRRPFKDPNEAEEVIEVESADPELDDEGRMTRKKKKKVKNNKKLGTARCHICCGKELIYKLQHCTKHGCTESYCYGVLYRAFDMMPQTVMEDLHWVCPKCEGICNCSRCIRAGNTIPYEPKNTLLGHNTRPIADDRSIEALVDFRVHNLSWLKSVGEEPRTKNSRRMRRLQAHAESEKARHGTGLEEALNAAAAGVAPPATGDGQPSGAETGTESSYPDPLGVGRERMLGMGYYEQDDAPDKILFDHYQRPTVEAFDDPQESEYIKTARSAKRKTRQDNEDDPDFLAPHDQKKRKGQPGDVLDHVDPALFIDGAMACNVSNETAAEGCGQAIGQHTPCHSKPIASYVEMQELINENVKDTSSIDLMSPHAGRSKRGRAASKREQGPYRSCC